MKELSKYSDDPEQVGCSFTVWVDLLNDLYTEYCANMNESNRIIALPDAMSFFTVCFRNLELNYKVIYSHLGYSRKASLRSKPRHLFIAH